MIQCGADADCSVGSGASSLEAYFEVSVDEGKVKKERFCSCLWASESVTERNVLQAV